jgi:hypothetical protein
VCIFNFDLLIRKKMKKNLVAASIMFLSILISPGISGEKIDSTAYILNSRLSFYSYEKNGEFLLHIPSGQSQSNLSIKINIGKETIASWSGKPGRIILRIPFPINLLPSLYKAEARITVNNAPSVIYLAAAKLTVLAAKPNEVKTDRLTGGLIVNRLLFFPFGFYCYSPVYPGLPEEEIVKGFNMISPYQKIMPETLNERKAYMDRCAELGMKVHYNLLSVSGGGGVGSKIEGLSDGEKRERLIAEIKTFMDHPALLCWYIADEPNGYNIPPAQMESIYNTVKETDPWHPVTMVFMSPFLSSKKYKDALDVVMADPYPIPDLPVSLVGSVTAQLKEEFTGKKPVWIVQQAFGGGEIWGREPTPQEIRSMTWLSVIKGATGIQYFVRQGLNYFPKSAAAWSECGKIAVEIAELTPWLLSDESSYPVESYSENVIVSSRLHNGQLIVMAVNKLNEPQSTSIRITGINNTRARILFENRSVNVNGGLITAQLPPYGSEVFLISTKTEKPAVTASNDNLIKDPGFEDLSSPGIPSACYARPGGDRGATYFLDSREHSEGFHSLRIITPADGKSLAIRFFPVKVKAGSSYIISIWAKSDPEQRIFSATNQKNNRLSEKKDMPQYVELLLGEFAHARFIPNNEWKRYVTFVTIPSDTLASFKTNLILRMPGQGVAWFDDVKVYEEKH